jgi:hypothetical protein
MDAAFRDELREAEERAERRMREAMDALGQAETRTRYAVQSSMCAASSPAAARTGLTGERDWRATPRSQARPALTPSGRWTAAPSWTDAATPTPEGVWAERVVPAKEGNPWRAAASGAPLPREASHSSGAPAAAMPHKEKTDHSGATGTIGADQSQRRSTSTRPGYRRVVLISSRVEQREQLAAAAMDGVVALCFDWSMCNLETLLETVRRAVAQVGESGAARIALVTHGRPGTLGLVKGARVTAESLAQPEIQSFWRSLAGMVEIGGSVDLIGCRVACSEEGRHIISELQKLTGLQINAVEAGESDVRSDCSTEPGTMDPGELYFERTKLAAWSATASRHLEVHERKAAKRERHEADRSASEAEYQVSAAKRVLTRARKTAETRAESEAEARLSAERLCEQLQEQLQAETAARTAAEQQLQASNDKVDGFVQSTQSMEAELEQVRRALQEESSARLALDREMEAVKAHTQAESQSRLVAEKQVQELIGTLARTEERLQAMSKSYETATGKIAELEAAHGEVASQARAEAVAEKGQSIADDIREQLAEEYAQLQARTTAAEDSVHTSREQAQAAESEASRQAQAQREAEERMRKAEHEYSMANMRLTHLEQENARLEAQLDALDGVAEWKLLPEAQAQASAARQAQQRRAQEQIDKAASFFAAKAIEAEQAAPNAILEERLAAEAAARISAEDRTDAMIARAERAEEMVARAEVVKQQAIEEAVETAVDAAREEAHRVHNEKLDTVRATADSQIWAVKADCEAQIRTIQSQSEAQVRAVVESEAEIRGVVEMQKQERERAVVIAADLQELNNQLREAAANAEARATTTDAKLQEAADELASAQADQAISKAKVETQEVQHRVELERAVAEAIENTTTRYREQQGKAVETAELLAVTRAEQEIQLSEMRVQNEARTDIFKAQAAMEQAHSQALDELREQHKRDIGIAIRESEEKAAARMERERAEIREAAESRSKIATLEADARVDHYQEMLAKERADVEKRIVEAESRAAADPSSAAADPKELSDLREEVAAVKTQLDTKKQELKAEKKQRKIFQQLATAGDEDREKELREEAEEAEREAKENIERIEQQAKAAAEETLKRVREEADSKVREAEERARKASEDADAKIRSAEANASKTGMEDVEQIREQARAEAQAEAKAQAQEKELETLTAANAALKADRQAAEERYRQAEEQLVEEKKNRVEEAFGREKEWRDTRDAEAEKFENKLAAEIQAKTAAEAAAAKAKKEATAAKAKTKAESASRKQAQGELMETKQQLDAATKMLEAARESAGKSKEEQAAAVAAAQTVAEQAAREELEMMKQEFEVAVLEREDSTMEEQLAEKAETERALAEAQRQLEKRERKEEKRKQALAREKVRQAGDAERNENLAKEMEQSLLSVEKELETKEEEMASLTREMEELKEELSAVTKDLEQEISMTQQSHSERDTAVNELAAERQKVRQLQAQIESTSEPSTQASPATDTEQMAAQEKERRIAVEAQLQEAQARIGTLEQSSAGPTGSAGSPSGDVDQGKVKLLEAEAASLKVQVAQLEKELQETKLTALQAPTSSSVDPGTEERLKTLTQKVSEKDAKLLALTSQVAQMHKSAELQNQMAEAARREAEVTHSATLAALESSEQKLRAHLAAKPAATSSGASTRRLATEMSFDGDFDSFPKAGSNERHMFEEGFKAKVAAHCIAQQITAMDVTVTGYRGGSVVVEFSISVSRQLLNTDLHKSLEVARTSKMTVGTYAAKEDVPIPAFTESADPDQAAEPASGALAVELAESQSKQRMVESGLQAAEGKVRMLEMQLASSKDERETALTMTKQMHDMEKQTLELKIGGMESKVQMLENQLTMATNQAAAAQQQVAQMQILSPQGGGGVPSLEAQQQISTLQAELGLVREQLTQEKAHAALQASMGGAAGGTNPAMQQQVTTLQAELGLVREQLAQSQAQIALQASMGGGGGGSAEAQVAQQQVTTLQAQLALATKQVTELQAQGASSGGDNTEELETLKAELASKEEELDELQDEMMGHYDEQETLNETIATLEEEVEVLKSERDELKAELEEVQEQLEAQQDAPPASPARARPEPVTAAVEEAEDIEDEDEDEDEDRSSKKKKKKKKKGPIDNSTEDWSELEGWIKKDDKKRYARLTQTGLTLTKKDDVGSKPTMEMDLQFVTGVRAGEEFVQIEYDGVDVDLITKDEDEAQLWEECIMQNVDLLG